MEGENARDERFKFANRLIEAGEIRSLQDIYKVVPIRIIALGLGLNPVSFSNTKAHFPASFKFGEIVRLSQLLNIQPIAMVQIFLNSLPD